jgi:hypothetical protein
VEWTGVAGHADDFTRNWSYTALSRARDATEIYLIDGPTEHQLERNEIGPHHPKELRGERTPRQRLQAAMRRSDDEDLALDHIDSARPLGHDLAARALVDAPGPARLSIDELRRELAEVLEQLGRYPERLNDGLDAARAARTDAQTILDNARARIAEFERPRGGLLRRRHGDPAALAFELETLNLAQRQRCPDRPFATEPSLNPRPGGRRRTHRKSSVAQARRGCEGSVPSHRPGPRTRTP